MRLGNLNAKRDIGHAKEYVEGMWRMLQQEIPDDFVLATGKTYSIREIVEMSARHLGMTIEWQGEGVNELGMWKEKNLPIVEIDEKYFRPSEVDLLIGDAEKAKNILGWQPSMDLDQILKEMVDTKKLENGL